MQAIGQRSAAPYTGFDAVTPPPAPPAPAAPPEAIAHAAPAEQPHQDGAPAPQAHSFNNKGPLRVADTARPARQIPDWVPGQPPALAGLNTAQPAARLEPSEGRLRTPGGLASLMSAGTPLSALQNLPLPLTPIAAAATKAATPADPAAPAAPKADPMEIAALELLLAEPENQDMIRHFGGELKPLPTWTTVGQGIEARYGQDLGSRLNQLQTAQRAVETEFFNAMDAARQAKLPRLPQHPVSMRRNEPAPESGVPGWVYQPGDGHSHGRSPGWAFDPAAFARHYAQGDSPAQRAFAHLHGPEAVRFVPAPNTEAGGTNSWSLNGRTLVLGRKIDRREEGLTSDSVAASQNGTPDWAPSRVQRPDTQLDPDRITKLHNKEFVWFDPQLGWSTDDANIKQSGLDRAFPYIFAGAITAMTFGAGSTVAAGISSAAGGGTAGNLAVAAATGAVSNAALQLAANGRINFGQLLQSALSAGATAGIAHLPGVGQHLDGLAGTAAQRLMEYTGRASVQGALQAIMGGNFRDGMANSLLGSLAGEVGQQLNAHINQLQVTHGLNASEASALRLLSRAASSALRVAGSGDAAAGFASDFLGGLLGDALQEHPGTSRTEPQDPLGEFIAANEQRRAALAEIDRQIEWELQAEEARQASLLDDDMFINTGGVPRGGARLGAQPVVMVRNGNWDSALNIAADPLGLLSAMQDLQGALGDLNRVNAEAQLNDLRQRMRAAGMTDVPTTNRQAWVAGGNIVTDYSSTLSDLQTRYEDFRRDQRLRDTWGDDYQNIRIGRQGMTVLEFERTMLNAQQRAMDAAFVRGRELMAAGKLPIELGYTQTLGTYIDQQVRDVLRSTAQSMGINENSDSTRLAVNRRISSMVDGTYGLPDLRIGGNIYADTTLARKNPNTPQIRLWDYINRGHYLIMRPTAWGGPYALPRNQIRPYAPNQRR